MLLVPIALPSVEPIVVWPWVTILPNPPSPPPAWLTMASADTSLFSADDCRCTPGTGSVLADGTFEPVWDSARNGMFACVATSLGIGHNGVAPSGMPICCVGAHAGCSTSSRVPALAAMGPGHANVATPVPTGPAASDASLPPMLAPGGLSRLPPERNGSGP